MYLPNIQLYQPETLSDVSRLLAEHSPDVRILAGGTDLLVDLKTARINFNHIVSLNAVDKLKGIIIDDDGLHIGALTTISEFNRCSEVKDSVFYPIRDASTKMAALQVRNVATVGGNIVSAVPCADMPPILMVMNASVILWSPTGERSVPLDSFFVGPRNTQKKDAEILTQINVPVPAVNCGIAYERFALRDGNAIAVASVAAGLCLDSENIIQNIRLALGAVAPIPKLVQVIGSAFTGRPFNNETINEIVKLSVDAAQPITDIRGSIEYRKNIVGILTKRALVNAADRIRSGVVK